MNLYFDECVCVCVCAWAWVRSHNMGICVFLPSLSANHMCLCVWSHFCSSLSSKLSISIRLYIYTNKTINDIRNNREKEKERDTLWYEDVNKMNWRIGYIMPHSIWILRCLKNDFTHMRFKSILPLNFALPSPPDKWMLASRKWQSTSRAISACRILLQMCIWFVFSSYFFKL